MDMERSCLDVLAGPESLAFCYSELDLTQELAAEDPTHYCCVMREHLKLRL